MMWENVPVTSGLWGTRVPAAMAGRGLHAWCLAAHGASRAGKLVSPLVS